MEKAIKTLEQRLEIELYRKRIQTTYYNLSKSCVPKYNPKMESHLRTGIKALKLLHEKKGDS